MYFDGAFSYEGAGAEVVIKAPTGEQLKYVIEMDFEKSKTSNNVAEYEGRLAGLHAVARLGIQQLMVRGDSQLVVH